MTTPASYKFDRFHCRVWVVKRSGMSGHQIKRAYLSQYHHACAVLAELWFLILRLWLLANLLLKGTLNLLQSFLYSVQASVS